jgi:hypothetical protein
LRAFSFGTLPDRLKALVPRSATKMKGSATGGLMLPLAIVSPVGSGPERAFLTSA